VNDPVLGDIHLAIDTDGRAEVWVEVDGQWRVAIRELHAPGCIVSHFVCTDQEKPRVWPLAEIEQETT
jgi:hypothetical protein